MIYNAGPQPHRPPRYAGDDTDLLLVFAERAMRPECRRADTPRSGSARWQHCEFTNTARNCSGVKGSMDCF